MNDVEQILNEDRAIIGQEIDTLIDNLTATAPPRIVEAVAYSLQAGGKRLRPTLVLRWSAAACGEVTTDAKAAALAIELIHTFSLVHDDLPAMDDDDLRRGVPTNHKHFQRLHGDGGRPKIGEATAILAGDAMTMLAFEVLADRATPARVGPLVKELAAASGPVGMIGGQMIDIANEHEKLNLPALRDLHARKTGALFTAACRLGVIAGGGDNTLLDAATTYGRHFGLAFQMTDDVLDETADAAAMGKATGKDRAGGKNTYPALLGVERSRAEAVKQRDAALAAVNDLSERADPLRALAQFVTRRST
jgi:geranylgeranyl diphosphate synthase type II